jgi:hypothetical protein
MLPAEVVEPNLGAALNLFLTLALVRIIGLTADSAKLMYLIRASSAYSFVKD